MQTDKKEDRNTFFFPQIADDRSFIFAIRQNVSPQPAGCHHAVPSPYSPTPYYIYAFQFPATANTGRGKRLPLSKVSDYFANSNAQVRTKQLSLPKEFYRKTYNGK